MIHRTLRNELTALTVLLLFTALLYFPGLSGPFLFDDASNIVDNSRLTGTKETLLDWWGAAQSSGAGTLRRPIPMLSFAVQLQDGPPSSAFSLKLGNLAVHLVCGVALFVLASYLCRAMGLSGDSRYRYFPLLAAALWLTSPLLASTVLYPVQRMAQFSALFVISGLACYMYYRSKWVERAATPDEVAALALWLGIFTFLAVFSKENGILLPWLVVVLEACLLGGRWAGRRSLFAVRCARVAALLPVLAGMLFTLYQWDWVVGDYANRDFTITERLFTELRLSWEYLGWFFLPRIGELGLYHDDILLSSGFWSPVTTAISLFAWCLVIGFGIAIRLRFPWLLMAALFFLSGHSIESGILPLEIVFEHRNYLPLVGPVLLLAAVLHSLAFGLKRLSLHLGPWLPAVFVLILFSSSLGLRASVWSSDLELASASYGRHPDSQRSRHFYASTLIRHRNNATVSGREADEYLLVARHEFERSHIDDPLDLSALVMLYTIDSLHATEAADPERWFAGIERSVSKLKLRATEYASMRVLVACVAGGGCQPTESRMAEVVRVFSERFPGPYAGTQLRLQLLEAVAASSTERISLLESALEDSPHQLSHYYPLISAWLDEGNFSAAHLVILALIDADEDYRHLSTIAAMFKGGSS
ncbi:MAG: hypothetical protein ACI8RN_002169 [Glaciecola sp.]|uniref:hypothetical protein n=1 Tax=Congregibacter sp. TaxID=2744308 RepID=UPI0039E312E7